MTREEITRLAREAGFVGFDGDNGSLRRFAALVADAEAKRMHDEGMVTVGYMRQQIAAEREACAALIESRNTGANELMDAVRDMEAKAIRARGQT
jgi:hypothetical protein